MSASKKREQKKERIKIAKKIKAKKQLVKKHNEILANAETYYDEELKCMIKVVPSDPKLKKKWTPL